jgi:hypothetical protein
VTILLEIIERAAAGIYGEDSEFIGRLAGLFNATKFDQGWGPFICGANGIPGTDGLHESYMICPSYGADLRNTALYQRVTKSADSELTDEPGVNRIEVIRNAGRAYIFWGEEGECAVKTMRQDQGRTLKIFVSGVPGKTSKPLMPGL